MAKVPRAIPAPILRRAGCQEKSGDDPTFPLGKVGTRKETRVGTFPMGKVRDG